MKPANYAPLYACMYPELCELFRTSGYALAIHGSLAKDFDMIAVPWVNECESVDAVLEKLSKQFQVRAIHPSRKAWNRLVYTIIFEYGHGAFFDLSFVNKMQALTPQGD